MRAGCFGFAVILLFWGVTQSKADLLPIVDPHSNCSGHGTNMAGQCACNLFYYGRECEYKDVDESCLVGYDCYDCAAYDCPEFKLNTILKNVTICDGTSTTTDPNNEHKELSITLQTACRNISSLCYKKYDCCPHGIAYIGTTCFRDDLLNNFSFFLMVMGFLTVFSTLFEIGIHKLEHHLEHKNQKALLGIVQTFKSELTLIGLIGLTLYLVSSSELFEHAIHTLGGTEEIIEAIHFLIFFLIIGYMFTLAFCFIFSRLLLNRRFHRYEKIFQQAREAAFRGENYEEFKKELEAQHKTNGYWSRKRYEEYNAYRKYFMITMKSEYSEEELMFFRFDEYYILCVNELIGKISGGTWLAWIFFAWNFFSVVYLQNWMALMAKAVFFGLMSIGFLVNAGARSAIFNHLKKEQEEQSQAEFSQKELLEIGSAQPPRRPVKIYPTLIIIINQSVIWLGLTNIITSFFSVSSLTGFAFNAMLITFGFVIIVYGFVIFQILPTIGGALYTGVHINKHFVKEVMKRHPQVDKQILIDQYRDQNNGQLPVIYDAFFESKNWCN